MRGDELEIPDLAGHQRTGRRRLANWLLLEGNRMLVAAGIVLAVFVVVGGLELVDLVPWRDPQASFYLFGGLISGNLTLITVVVSISQLLLSRELATPGELESQMENVIDYRRDVEDAADAIAPIQPLGFLRLLYENTRQEAQKLGGLATTEVSDEPADDIREFVDVLTDHADTVDDLLAESEADTFDVLSVSLTTNYARQIDFVRRLRARYDDELPDEVSSRLDRLVDRLREIDVARQYFKSIYLQEELSQLSRVLLYAGVPAQILVVSTLLTFTVNDVSALRTPVLEVVVPVVVAGGFVPLAVLAAFILRIATVTQRTAAMLPFTTPNQEL